MPVTSNIRFARGAATSPSPDAAAPDSYRLRLGVPEPLSRLALQRMRRPETERDKLEFFHMTTDSFKRISFELLRYCQGEIDGFSVLIAGQRGAGKTTLAKLAIQKVMQESNGLIPLPLLLHGPTIIDPEATTSEAKTAAEDATDFERQLLESYQDNSASKNTAPKEKERALRQIITALYRSFSTAIYDAWLNAADESPEARRARRELLALRAHIDLRLERAPDSDVLRKIWSRAGFLHSGVAFYLRPASWVERRRRFRHDRDHRTPPLAGHEDDQGLREIVALAACADAYRVILGDTKERLRREQRREEQQELRAPGAVALESKKAEADSKAKSPTEKLGPPVIGTVAGGLAGLAQHGGGHAPLVWGLAVGAAVWLATWAAAVYGVRKSTRDTSRELTLDIKWDIDRLERDLPVLLRRVKDAGFAPIFILDELDKVDDATKTLDNFLKYAKHIATDHAAFMFLTNRDYFEVLYGGEQLDIGSAR